MPRKQKKFHFIYKTTCLITNRFYIGMHSTDDLNDGYLGSGKRLWYSIKKHGKDNHKIEYLEFYDDRKKLRSREREIINEKFLENPLCMNLILGGEGGWEHLNANSEIQRKKGIKGNEKMKWLSVNDEEWKNQKSKKLSESIRKAYQDGRKTVNTPDWTGKHHNSETKRKIGNKSRIHQLGKGNSQYGTCWIHNLKLKKSKKINKEEFDVWLQKGWKKGRKIKF